MEAFKVTLSMSDYPYLVIAEDIEGVIPTLNAQSNLFPYQFHNFYIDKIERINDYTSNYIIVQDKIQKDSDPPIETKTDPIMVLTEAVTNPNENVQIKAEEPKAVKKANESPEHTHSWAYPKPSTPTALSAETTQPKTEAPAPEPKEETPSNETENKYDYDAPHLSPDGREPLKSVKVGDIVAYWEDWKGSKNKGLLLVKSFDYGDGDLTVNEEHPYGASAPRCLWGKSAIGGDFYGDYAPGALYYYPATEEEKTELIDSIPTWRQDGYKNLMEKVQEREKQTK